MRAIVIDSLDKNVIVTGGGGYIGSHACKALNALGYTPITLDNFSTGWIDAVKFGPLETVDLLEQSQIEKIFEKYQPVAVMHFAAFSQVGESVVDPIKYWRNNVQSSINLFEACVTFGCENIIFSSTCATYGDHDNLVLTEATEQRPVNPYGASKRAIEEILKQISVSSRIKYVIFRYFNVAGADPDGEIGEFHKPETHLVPLTLEAINGQRDAITVFGTDYDTSDGTCIRDYVHVSDIVDAHVLGLSWLESGGANRIFNLGTGTGFSVSEVIDYARLVTNRPVPIIKGARRFGDPTRLVADPELARRELGWEPKRSTLKHIISDAWRWHQTGGYNS